MVGGGCWGEVGVGFVGDGLGGAECDAVVGVWVGGGVCIGGGHGVCVCVCVAIVFVFELVVVGIVFVLIGLLLLPVAGCCQRCSFSCGETKLIYDCE